MRLTTRTGFVLAAALPLLALCVAADEGPTDEEAMHEAHVAEGGTCPMVMEAQRAATADLVADLDRASQKLIALAEAIPAEQYGWAPSEEVRTVSEVFMHVVGSDYLMPAALGATPPEGLQMEAGGPFATMKKWEDEVTEKDAVIAKLKAAVEYAKGAVGELGEMDMEEKIELFGPPMSRRGYLLVLLTHTHEHLGQSIAYARSLGVVPPWSRPAEGEGG